MAMADRKGKGARPAHSLTVDYTMFYVYEGILPVDSPSDGHDPSNTCQCWQVYRTQSQ